MTGPVHEVETSCEKHRNLVTGDAAAAAESETGTKNEEPGTLSCCAYANDLLGQHETISQGGDAFVMLELWPEPTGSSSLSPRRVRSISPLQMSEKADRLLLSEGGFRHGQHLAYDGVRNKPLCNLFVSMLQRMGVEAGAFASGSATLAGLEAG